MERTSRVRSILDISSSVFMITASAVLIWFAVASRFAATSAGSPPAATNAVEDLDGAGLTVSLADVPRLGATDARVVLIEFSDFECPFCKRYAQETFQAVKEAFVDSGKVAYAYMPLPLTNIHPNALPAAGAAVCAGEQGRFWEMYERLFTSQNGLDDARLMEHVSELRLDTSRLATCRQSVTPRIQAAVEEARRLGIQGTPTFLLGTLEPNGTVAVHRRINGARPLDVFESAIDEVLARR